MRAPPAYNTFSASWRQWSTCSPLSTSMLAPTTPSLPMKDSDQINSSTMETAPLIFDAFILQPRQRHLLVQKRLTTNSYKRDNIFAGKNKKPQNIMEILFMTCSWMTGVFFFSILVGLLLWECVSLPYCVSIFRKHSRHSWDSNEK